MNLIRPEVPAELAALVGRMMSKDPRRRFQTPREAADALRPFFKGGANNPLERPVRPATLARSAGLDRPKSRTDTPWASLVTDPDLDESVELAPKPSATGRRIPRKAGWAVAALLGIFFAASACLMIAKVRIKAVGGDARRPPLVESSGNSSTRLEPGPLALAVAPPAGNSTDRRPELKPEPFPAAESAFEPAGPAPVPARSSPEPASEPVGQNPSPPPAAPLPKAGPPTSSGPGPDPSTIELIKNPGAEMIDVGDEISGWMNQLGGWSNHARDLPPREGKSYFSPGKAAYAELTQVVDVGGFANQIDDRKNPQTFRFLGHVRSGQKKKPDAAQVVIEFLAGKQGRILNTFAFPPVKSIDGWHALETVLTPPAQTRSIRISLRSHGGPDEANDAVFDALSLTAIPPTHAVATKATRPVAIESVRRTSHTLVLDGTWRIEKDELIRTDRNLFATLLLGDVPPASYNFEYKIKMIDSRWGPRMFHAFHYQAPLQHSTATDRYWFEIKEKKAQNTDQYAFTCSYPDGEWHREGEYEPIVPLEYGRWYDVELQVRGKQFRVLFDNKEILQQFARIGSGWVGLGSADCITRFKDISVTTPKGEILWQGLPDELPAKD